MDKIDKRRKPRLRKLSEEDKIGLEKKYRYFVVKIVKERLPFCRLSQIQDLVQEAWPALVDSAERFDENWKVRFTTYAGKAIKRKIKSYLDVFEKELHTPAHVTVDRYKYREARKKLKEDNGEEPSLEEISEETKIPIGRLKLVVETDIKHPPTFLHIDQSSEKEGSPLGKAIVDNQGKFKGAEELLLTKEVLLILQKCLTPREIETIRLRIGLDGNDPLTFKKISARLGFSGERNRQIYEEAIKKLQKALND